MPRTPTSEAVTSSVQIAICTPNKEILRKYQALFRVVVIPNRL